MSLLSEYFKERGVKEIIETESGFITYYFLPEGCYVEDIYVRQSDRDTGLARIMLDQVSKIAREKGCNKLFGSCVPSSKGATESLSMAFLYGFKLHNSVNNLIVYVKNLTEIGK
jgi:hypothetical protein